MKRSLFVFVLMVLTVTLFGVTVTMVYWPGPEAEAMQKVVEYWNSNFGEKDDIIVEIINFSRDEFWTKEEALLGAHSSDIDIVFVATYILGRYANHLVPLEGFNLDPKVFIASSLESMSFEGLLYGLPMDVSNHFLYYRKDLLEELLNNNEWKKIYGDLSEKYLGKRLVPKSPENWDWDDYKAMALFFTKKYNQKSPTLYGNVLQMKNLVYNIMIWNDVLWSMGGKWFDENGKFNINTPEAKQAALLYKELYDLGTVPPGAITYEYGEANQAFQLGRTFMMIQWSAAYHTLTNPDESPMVFDKVGVTHIPGPNPSTHVHSLGVGLSKYSKNKMAALEFLKFLSTEEAMKIYASNGGIPPVETVLKELSSKRPEFSLIAEHIKNYGFVESTSGETMSILQILSDKLTAIWTGKLDVEEGLQQIQIEVEKLLNEK
ncbi:MAG: multiple sugar transport system substrate-binding protein [Thermosipho sp. (in: thermotogales)]|nr:multiple sugar transport system substrate-binding protein [Thermosipho sp. (in: thermotogales)]